MKEINRLKLLPIIVSIILFLAAPTIASAQSADDTTTPSGTTLSQMKVSFWPEYDSQSVLAIYRGQLKDSNAVPATVKILIPKGAKVASTAAVDPNGQFQYDQAWASHKVTPGADYDVLTYETIYPNFQCELYFNQIGAEKQRNFDFTFKTAMAAETLQIEIQKPLKSSNFKITPSTTNTADSEGFTYYLYSLNNPEIGQESSYTVSYTKANNQPSTTGQTKPVNHQSRRNAILGILAALILIGGSIGAAVWRSSSVNKVQKKKLKNYPTAKYGKKTKKKHFCANCGAELKKKDKFCPACGRPT